MPSVSASWSQCFNATMFRSYSIAAICELFVLSAPARGLDIAATGFVHRQLLSRRAAGCGILLISSEWEELFALCDRVAVLYGGRLTMSRFPQDGAVEIGRMMTGAQDDKVTR